MAGRYGSSTSGGRYGGATSSGPGPLPKPKKKKGGHSFGGFAGNFAGEIGAFAGIPAGIIALGKGFVKDPVGTGKGLGQAAWKSHIASEFKQAAHGPTPIWSKEARKDFQYMYDHPLSSILDVTLLASAAAGTSAKAARVVAPGSKIAEASRPSKLVLKDPLGKGRPDVELATGTGSYVNPFKAGRKKMFHDLSTPKMRARRYERHRSIRDRRDLTFVENAWNGMFAAAKAITETGPVRQAKQADIVKNMHAHFERVGQEMDELAPGYEWIRAPQGPHRANARAGHSFVEKKTGVWKEVKGDHGAKVIKSGEGYTLRKTGKTTWRKVTGTGMESDYTPRAFEAALRGGKIRQMFTTKNMDEVSRGPNGKGLAVQKRIIDDYSKEAANSHRSLTDLVENVTRPWRAAVLGTPRYAVNNVVGGTSIMLINNPTGLKYYVRAAANVHGKAKASKIFSAQPGKGVRWVDEVFGHVRGHGFAKEVPTFNEARLAGKVANVERKWYDYVNRWAEESYRVSAVMQRVRRDPEIIAMRKRGLTEDEAVLAKARGDRQWVHQVSDDVDDMFGQYHYHNKLERNIRSLGVPFYGWYRAISRSTTNTFKDRPGRAIAMMQLGNMGIEDTERQLGEIPHFMRGVIPLGKGPLAGTPGEDRKSILTTQGLNPYATPADVGTGIGALLGGPGRVSETLGGAFGPVPATVIESMTGRDLLTDVPHKKNVFQLAMQNFGLDLERGSIPQIQAIQAFNPQPAEYRTESGRKGTKLYAPDQWNTLLAISGFPRKYVSPGQAKKRARSERKETPY